MIHRSKAQFRSTGPTGLRGGSQGAGPRGWLPSRKYSQGTGSEEHSPGRLRLSHTLQTQGIGYYKEESCEKKGLGPKAKQTGGTDPRLP